MATAAFDRSGAARGLVAPAVEPDHRAAALADHRWRWRRQASLTTAVGVIARGVAVAVRLVTIPLALRLLGPDRYGLWLSVGSVLAWIGLVGPGLGYGLINAVGEARGRDDWTTMRAHVSTGIIALSVLATAILLLAPIAGSWSGWADLLGITNRPDLIHDTRTLIAVAIVLFALSLSQEIVTPICTGLQEGYLSALASIGASVAMLVGVTVLAWRGGTLVAFAIVVGLAPVIANCVLGVYLLTRRHPRLRPSWRLWNRASFRSLIGFGGWMFIGQFGELAIFQSANILIAHRFGPGEVPRYAVPAAVFVNIANLCYLMVQPYWPAVREASVRGDWEWVRTALRSTLWPRLGLVTAAALAIILAGPQLIGVWAGEQAVPARSLLVAMGVYYTLVVWSGNYVVQLLGLGLVRAKTMLTLVVGAAHVAGFFLLSPTLGLSAIPVAGSLGVLADCLIASRLASRHIRAQVRHAQS